jgi:hypothetical protein
MGESNPVAALPEAQPRRRRLRIILGLLVTTVVVLTGLLVYDHVVASRSLEAALAEADRLDPNWRAGELEAGREVIPDAVNAARLALAVHPLLPAGWPAWDSEGPGGVPVATPDAWQGFKESLEGLPPPVRLSAAQADALRKELRRAADALAEGRKLKDLPRGRYPHTAANPFMSSREPHWGQVRDLARLLAWDGWLHAQEQDLAAALASAHAALNAGRSLGDEPGPFPQEVRRECRARVLRLLERALAQGEPPPAALETLQRALAEEAEQPLLLAVFRGYRAILDWHLERVQDRTISRSLMEKSLGMRPSGGAVSDVAYALVSGTSKRHRADVLAYLTRCVEVAKFPAEEHRARLTAVNKKFANASGLVAVMTSACDYQADSCLRSLAELRCAAVALAVERYRQKHQCWPETLASLVPDFLSAVPVGPFDREPPRLLCSKDGRVVYTLGPDAVDYGGTVEYHPNVPGMDIGFRLWDVDLRRKPPATTPALPPAGR